MLTGPLFSFDVHDDIRLVNDATVEKDEVRNAQKKIDLQLKVKGEWTDNREVGVGTKQCLWEFNPPS